MNAWMNRSAYAGWSWLLSGMTAVVDAGPDVLRYGIGRSIRNKIFARRLSSLESQYSGLVQPQSAFDTSATETQRQTILVTRSLGIGGVEAIVASLARYLPRFGLDIKVVCQSPGVTAEAIRAMGIEVVEASDKLAAEEFVARLPADSIAELHNAPGYLSNAFLDAGIPTVSVIHSTDVNLNAHGWDFEADMRERVWATVAVSDTVRSFYDRRMPRPMRSEVVVIPNGIEMSPVSTADSRNARALLESTLRIDLDKAILFACLARYDLQKNIPGLVASFLEATKSRSDIHLVVAGPIEDWLEHALSDALRRSHASSDQIHLMTTGSASTMLAASDAFILNSFFEGWPVAATEAAMAGLPMILSDVGGAVELVGDRGERGRLISNPAGPSAEVDLPRIRAARRRVASQRNRNELRDAVLKLAEDIDSWRGRRSDLSAQARAWLSAHDMAKAHARLLNQVPGHVSRCK